MPGVLPKLAFLVVAALKVPFCESSWFQQLSPSINGWHSAAAYETPQSTQQSRIGLTVRGGSLEEGDEDSERYSRQVYTLGERAHALIRSSTVYIDGPCASGLVYECAKNLALSGVRHLVVVRSDHDHPLENHYHNAALDDLGKAYQRAARSEIEEKGSADELPEEELLVGYLQRLNPNILVSLMDRSSLTTTDDQSTRRVLLCVDRPASMQSALNLLARKNDWAFVAVETAGVFGRTFSDFGPSFQVHDADGENPTITPLERLEVSLEDTLVVHCVLGEKHDVSKGDQIEFLFRNGQPSPQRCLVKDVQTPFRFVVELVLEENNGNLNEFVATINEDAASFRRIKIPQEVKSQPFHVALDSSKTNAALFVACDLEKSFDSVRREASMACFQALTTFVENLRRLPTMADIDTFVEMAKADSTLEADGSHGGKEDSKHYRSFLRGCNAKFTPLQAIFGALGAQEALKAATGLYNPIHQFLLYDCDEVLDDGVEIKQVSALTDDSHDTASGLRYILGDDTVDQLQAKRIFVVGAGAIGCEILKNLAAMNAATKRPGKIILTDMDTIEKSNLSRQLLFRDSNIGNFKSTAAKQATRRFNPAVRIKAHSSKVGGEGHSPFDKKFWSKKVDVVLNALDNVEARLFMDGRCVANQKALVDAGTMGPKGNVQVVIPHQSESYASSVDPPEPAIPVCTLKNFPYAISHTIQWGRNLFDDLFVRRPSQANNIIDVLPFIGLDELADRLLNEKGESALEAAKELDQDFEHISVGDKEKAKEACLQWAARLAFEFFYKAPKDVLEEHPLDSVDEDQEPFWSGTRRPPKALKLLVESDDAEQELINANLLEFVRMAARLRYETLSTKAQLETTFDIEAAKHAFGVEYSRHAERAHGMTYQSAGDGVVDYLRKATDRAPERKMTLLEFEKDVDSNGHVSFIAAASNLRAICFGIPPVDKMETRRVAGNIVPAMITTTAFVSALSCIELIKLTQQKPLRSYRNAFINLALPFFAFTVPLPAEEIPGVGGKLYTLWDRLKVKESKKAAAAGGMKLKRFLRKVRKLVSDDPHSVEIASVSCGPFMLYANFLHGDDAEVLQKPIWDLVGEAVVPSEEYDADHARNEAPLVTGLSRDSDCLELNIVVEDMETGDELELPIVELTRYKNKRI